MLGVLPMPFLCAVAIAVVLRPLAASAHGAPIDLAFFGPFGAPTVQCVRAISFATQRCFHKVLALKRQCLDNQLSDVACDVGQRDAAIDTAKQAAQAAVAATCLGGQLTELRFNSFDEVKADV